VKRPPVAVPTPAVAAALALLPPAPGVYRMRDASGRVVYTGRSGDLRARVRSYWRDLRDRPHLARMLRSVAWVEPTVCESEHEAALFERHLLLRRRPPYNRTTGVEQLVHLRLTSDPAAPALDPVVLEAGVETGGELFGPYLGWEPARLAAAALNRLYPVRYSGDGLDPSRRELARSRGVGPGDRRLLCGRIRAVLLGRPRALSGALARLAELRDRAAADLQFEAAAELQRQLDALRWIGQARPRLGSGDVDVWAAAGAGALAVTVLLEVRAGRVEECLVRGAGEEAARAGRGDAPRRLVAGDGGGAVDRNDAAWLAMAEANADLAARLVAAGARPA
jgi:excinuclease ABC subunit C